MYSIGIPDKYKDMIIKRIVQVVHDPDMGYAVSYQQKRDTYTSTNYLMSNTNNIKFWKKVDSAKKAAQDIVNSSNIYTLDDSIGTY